MLLFVYAAGFVAHKVLVRSIPELQSFTFKQSLLFVHILCDKKIDIKDRIEMQRESLDELCSIFKKWPYRYIYFLFSYNHNFHLKTYII